MALRRVSHTKPAAGAAWPRPSLLSLPFVSAPVLLCQQFILLHDLRKLMRERQLFLCARRLRSRHAHAPATAAAGHLARGRLLRLEVQIVVHCGRCGCGCEGGKEKESFTVRLSECD